MKADPFSGRVKIYYYNYNLPTKDPGFDQGEE